MPPNVTRRAGVLFGSQQASQVFWADEPLKIAAVQAFVAAGRQAGDIARSGAPANRVGRSVRTRFFSGGAATGMDIAGIIRASNPLSHLFELGVKQHNIAPKASLASTIARGRNRRKGAKGVRQTGKVAMKFPDGGFSRGSVSHPGMRAQPFLEPAAAAFPALYVRELSRRI